MKRLTASEELTLLGAGDRLVQEGLQVASKSAGRGRVIYSLSEIPQSEELLTPASQTVRRVGNVVCVNGEVKFHVDFVSTAPVASKKRVSVLPGTQFWGLPDRITNRITLMLDEQSLLRLGSCCRKSYAMCTEPVLWMELFARRFGYLPPFVAPVNTAKGNNSAPNSGSEDVAATTMTATSPKMSSSSSSSSSSSWKSIQDYWISRVKYQRTEVRAFGQLELKVVPPEDACVKVVMLGPLNVGKTSLVNALCGVRNTNPVAPSMLVKTTVVSGCVGGLKNVVSLKFWDVPGDVRNKTVASVYCQPANVVMFVFDCSNEQSFTQLKEWVIELKLRINPKTQMFLIGNKDDPTGNRVLISEAIAFAKQEKLKFCTTNALENGGYEFKLLCWKLAMQQKKLNLL